MLEYLSFSQRPAVPATIMMVVGLLVFSSALIWGIPQKIKNDPKRIELKLRVRSWWIIVALLAAALLSQPIVSIYFFGFVSFVAVKEFFSMIPTRRADRRVLFWVYLAVPIQYYWVHIDWYGMFIIFIPVYLFLVLPLRMVTIGETKGFLNAVGTLQWGAMLSIFCISHLAYLMIMKIPTSPNQHMAGAGFVLFLVLLTELNDVAQFCWGKTLGRHKITPSVSPNKTVEGFVGGVVTTIGLAYLLSKILTPMTGVHAMCAGLLISVTGFIGDIVVSAIKRDLGVKDSGSFIPGHGGILDRIDSLTYTAPVFFHFVRYFYSA